MAIKKTTASMLSAVLLTSVLFSPAVWAEGAQASIVTEPGVQYKTHIQDYGWETTWKSNGSLSGTVGESKRLEALLVGLTGSLPQGASIQTYVHVQNRGDLGPFAMGTEAGTSGQGLRLESVRLVLNNMPGYRLLYNVQVQNQGWLKDINDPNTWFRNGETAGTSGLGLRLEGLRIKIVEVNEEYETYLSTLKAVNPYSYTSESWADYQEIVDANEMTTDNSKEEIIQAIANITAAQKDLVLAKNLTAYRAALASVQEVNYTPDTWSVYQDVVADNVVTKDDSQADINTALKNILEAQKKLQWKVNLTEYQATLDAVREEDYTAESWLVYQGVVSSYAMTENNTQPEVDAAVKKIDEAQKRMVKKFDFTAYNALLNAVKEEDYIETTWAIYQDVVDANFVDETFSQSDIEKAIKNIEEAQKKLIKKADLTYYQAVLDAVSKEDYTTASWNAYQKEVRSVVVNAMSKPEVIDEAVLKILSAQMNLVPAGDMRYYYAAINGVIRTDYTTASWDAYQKVVAANVVVPADGQEAIDAATEKIEAAQKKLEGAAEDLDEYNELIGLDQDNYTSASWATYQKVIDANFLKPQDGQSKINTAVTKLRAASLKLVERASDYTEYNKALKYNLYLGKDPADTTSTKPLVEMKQGDYTTSSWATYQKVLDANIMDPDKSQTQVNTAVANIKKAQYKLLKGGDLARYNTILNYNIVLGKDPDDAADLRTLKPMKEVDYTSTSWTAYQKILTANEMDSDKSQAQIDAAVVKITRAQQKLMERGDLEEYYDVLNLVKRADYTTKSWTEYAKKIASKGYFVTPDNTQAEINRAIDLIKLAQLNLQQRGDTDEYYDLIDKYSDQSVFKTAPWSAYLAVLAKNVVSSENTDSEIKIAVDAIKRAQAVLVQPENAASILTAYNEALAKTDAAGSYTPTSWQTYQNTIKPYLGYTKDIDQAKVNEATAKIIEAQQFLIRTNQAELDAFENVIEMYLRNKMQVGKGYVEQLNKYVDPGTWNDYVDTVEKYAAAYTDYTWQQTVINKDSRPEVIIAATEDIKKAIRNLDPDGINLDLDYSGYDIAVAAAKPWRDDLTVWPNTMAQVAPLYTQKSYDDYVRDCINYEIFNRIESTREVFMDQTKINNATSMITNAQATLYYRATESDIAGYNAQVTEFKTLRSSKSNYTTATWDNYEMVYLNSPANLNDLPNLKQIDCKSATDQLKAARDALKYTAVYVGTNVTKNNLQLPSITTGTNLLTRAEGLLLDKTKYKVEVVSVSGTPNAEVDNNGVVTGVAGSFATISFKITELADPTNNYVTVTIAGLAIS
ncbi:hypothetical protein [Acetobacterium wieringae]|uniref:hypothetical protein n=1 Tax=Acetobacterium wieringae TaxID=52694 RepID=UPI002033D0AA|nr:hypothetical protein [Acetobacterium wieringae]URN85239.1 hypothetical protein CHL1_000871 [Acetobacterium wieringae]